MLTFNFCGVDAVDDLGLIVNSIKRPVTPEITENTQDVPGMVGKIFLGNSYGQKFFQIDITLLEASSEELIEKISQLTDLVMTFGDREYPMIFSDNSAYVYYGHFTSVTTPVRVGSSATCTLTFACSDPKGYGEYESRDITINPLTITPNGTADCYPIFTCIPKNDVKKIAVADEEGNYVFIGADVDPDTGDTPIDLEPLVLHDECNTLAYWTTVTTPTFPVENGVVKGTMGSYPSTIRPNDFGSKTPGKWHGPLSLRWLPGAYDDFRIRVRLINIQSYYRAEGKIELYLLNSNGERIGKFMLKDNRTNNKVVYAQVQLGTSGNSKDLYNSPGTIKAGKTVKLTIKVKNGTKTITSAGKKKTEQLWKTITLDEDMDTSSFTNFYGYLELQKIGNKYRVEILKQNYNGNPGWSKPIVIPWTDTNNKFSQNQLAGIALYCAKADITEDTVDPVVNYKNNELAACDIQVWNIINGGNDSTKPVVIARNGDEIKINCEDHTVYKNGAYFMEKLYIGSEFLTMKGGIQRTFAFEPGLDEADWYMEVRPTTQ
ncbi:distal tail protein Dit [Neobacillus drentensis]|uniref:distal tail protein Dit n=1 Tax=Neobacillus drentensis TaxID=220684 RepID=UPI00286C022A|nr:distal tail protein Dit [Neobacillus drentensis]